jgi:hypothetical protein
VDELVLPGISLLRVGATTVELFDGKKMFLKPPRFI